MYGRPLCCKGKSDLKLSLLKTLSTAEILAFSTSASGSVRAKLLEGRMQVS
jgi:hypothetical protein